MIQNASPQSSFGSEKLGRLKRVLIHKPDKAIRLVNQSNYESQLFDCVPDVDLYLEEHTEYAEMLQSHNVEVLELKSYVHQNKVLMDTLPNLAYMHDIAVITSKGAILSKMNNCRRGEETVVKEALTKIQIPIFHEFGHDDSFEGCLLLSAETIFIANTERHSRESIERLIAPALQLFNEVLYVEIPKARRFMHPDMIYNRISNNLSLVYLPAFLHTYLITKTKRDEIDFATFMKSRGVELINISDQEQKTWGCSFVPLEPNVIFHYDIALNQETKKKLYGHGVEIIEFHPNALLAGGGSLRCLTMRLLRE